MPVLGDMVLKQRSEHNLQELVLLHHAGPGDRTQLSILAASTFYSLNWLYIFTLILLMNVKKKKYCLHSKVGTEQRP